MSKVTIFNRNDGDPAHAALVSSRLSNSVVSLLNYHGTTLKTYRIGDAKDVPSFDISFVSYLGCCIDSHPVRDLSYFAGELNLNGQSICIQTCMNAGYQYAGTQYSKGCWCGNSYGRYGFDPNGCNMPCAGNAAEMCGGPVRNSIYKTSQSGSLIIAPTRTPTLSPTNKPTYDPNKKFCGVDSCTEEVWNRIVDGQSCGARITELQTAQSYSLVAACVQVHHHYPSECHCRPANVFCSTHDVLCPEWMHLNGCEAYLEGGTMFLVTRDRDPIFSPHYEIPFSHWGVFGEILMQPDGKLVVRDNLQRYPNFWESGTIPNSANPYTLEVLFDCHLVIHDKYNTATWTSGPPEQTLFNVLKENDFVVRTGCPNNELSPIGEEVHMAIDGNAATKYLNPCGPNSGDRGFIVKTEYSTISAISMTTANDYPNRDPRNWKIRGSNDGDKDTFSLVAQGTFHSNLSRFETITMEFQRSNPFRYYWLTFDTSGTGDSHLQFAEIQLLRHKTYCGVDSCTQAVWNTIVDGQSCGERITKLQTVQSQSLESSCRQVHSQFPDKCRCRPSHCSSLSSSDVECPNELYSDTNACFAAMQQDGNLVIYKGAALWASNTVGFGAGAPYKWWMQANGNVVAHDRNGTPVWATNTNGLGAGAPYRLDMGDECALVVYDKNDAVIWTSKRGALQDCAVGTCSVKLGVSGIREGNYIGSVPVNSVVSCQNECMKRIECVSFILDSATEGGTCKLYSSLGGNGQYSYGGNNSYGRCSKPSRDSMGKIYIMNAGVGGYLSTRNINPIIKRDGQGWEEWTITKSTRDSTKYNIRDKDGRFLTAEGRWTISGYVSSDIVGFRTWEDNWELWSINRVSDDSVSIRGHFGKYLGASQAGLVGINTYSVGEWEKWKITNNNDVKGSGPDGEFVLAGAIMIPLAILAGSAAPALIAAVAGAGLSAAATAITVVLAQCVLGFVRDLGAEILKSGLDIDPSVTRVTTAPVAYAALF